MFFLLQRGSVTLRRIALTLLLLATGAAAAPRVELPVVVANDNRVPAGTLRDGVLTLDLVVVMARWYPEAADGPFAEVAVFAEEGKPPSVPGPLIRVPVGTRVRLSVRNTLPDSTITMAGLGVTIPGDTAAVALKPGSKRLFEFTAADAGTFLYAARTTPESPIAIETEQLAGAIVVDAPGARTDERILVMNIWSDRGPDSSVRNALAINGHSWPNTERFVATVGDTLHWRVVNATLRVHPMHLHGAYFRVDARGDGLRSDTLYSASARRMAVTEVMDPRTTMAMTWSPDTPGNWLFHCHLSFHVIPAARLDPPPGEHESHSDDPTKHMAGLVVGINVRPRTDAVATRRNVRHLTAVIAPGVRRDTVHLRPIALRLSPDGRAPDSAGVRPRGDLLLLTRGEPTDITVFNRLSEPTAIHWHGLELESFSDGVAGWSGSGARVAPAIAPNDSFVAHLTLKRAGTFIYHTHLNDVEQLVAGLYGPLVVLAPGERWDPTRDLVLTAGFDFSLSEGPVVNGGEADPPLAIRVGRPVRMRFINILPADAMIFEVLRDSTLAEWRPLAKDGYDLPRDQSVRGAATRLLWNGETFDAEFAPLVRGTYRLRVRSGPKDVIYERRLDVRPRQ